MNPVAPGNEVRTMAERDQIDSVVRREEAFYAALTASDAGALDEIISDDLTTFRHSTGVVDTKAEYLAGVREGRYRMVRSRG
jgi:hypothetical protein